MINNKEILDQFLNKIAEEIKAAVPKKFGDTVEVEADDYSGRIIADANIMVMEFGRGPTRPGAKKGNPTLFEQIKAWIDKKGLELNPYAVTRNIHKYGTMTWRMKGRTGILSNIITKVRAQSLVDTFGTKYASEVRTAI
jgi:hypothetical protein